MANLVLSRIKKFQRSEKIATGQDLSPCGPSQCHFDFTAPLVPADMANTSSLGLLLGTTRDSHTNKLPEVLPTPSCPGPSPFSLSVLFFPSLVSPATHLCPQPSGGPRETRSSVLSESASGRQEAGGKVFPSLETPSSSLPGRF